MRVARAGTPAWGPRAKISVVPPAEVAKSQPVGVPMSSTPLLSAWPKDGERPRTARSEERRVNVTAPHEDCAARTSAAFDAMASIIPCPASRGTVPERTHRTLFELAQKVQSE